jgi:hypothetical protein
VQFARDALRAGLIAPAQAALDRARASASGAPEVVELAARIDSASVAR